MAACGSTSMTTKDSHRSRGVLTPNEAVQQNLSLLSALSCTSVSSHFSSGPPQASARPSAPISTKAERFAARRARRATAVTTSPSFQSCIRKEHQRKDLRTWQICILLYINMYICKKRYMRKRMLGTKTRESQRSCGPLYKLLCRMRDGLTAPPSHSLPGFSEDLAAAHPPSPGPARQPQLSGHPGQLVTHWCLSEGQVEGQHQSSTGTAPSAHRMNVVHASKCGSHAYKIRIYVYIYIYMLMSLMSYKTRQILDALTPLQSSPNGRPNCCSARNLKGHWSKTRPLARRSCTDMWQSKGQEPTASNK